MLQGGGWLVVCVAASWALGFAAERLWLLAGIDFLVAAAGLLTVACARHNRLRLGSAVFISCCYLAIVGMSFFFDVPDHAYPRATHNFLIPLAFAAYLILQLEWRLVYCGVPLLCLATFLVLASSPVGYPLPYGIPYELRGASVWLSNLSAAACLFVVMVLMHSDIKVRTILEADLYRGIQQKELLLYYQPQVDLDHRVVGAEALVRWRHPERGLVPPGEFIPLAEQCGLIVPLGNWVLETACWQLVEWSRNPDWAHLTLAVNVSAAQILDANFESQVTAILHRTKVDPSRLKIELTESMLAKNLDDLMAIMARLRTRGIAISLDDFGTGYSSLSYVKRLPLDQLKIDQSFVNDVLTDPSDAAIVRTIMALSESLGLNVIAEGVETEAQRLFLQSVGCKTYQGYLFGRPLPAADFEAYMRQGPRG